MCGIAFVINYGESMLDLGVIESLFRNLNKRGTDSSGIYYERKQDGQDISRIIKAPVDSDVLWEAVQNSKYPDIVGKEFGSRWRLNGQEKLIMLHTRQATKGTYLKNENNMPILSDNWALVHNGCVTAKRLTDYPYAGEVDSEEILAYLETTRSIHHALSSVTGSMAVAIKSLSLPFMFLYRNSNPLDLVYFSDKKILIGASLASYVDEKLSKDSLSDLFGGATIRTRELPQYHCVVLDTENPEIYDIGSPYSVTADKSFQEVYKKYINNENEDLWPEFYLDNYFKG